MNKYEELKIIKLSLAFHCIHNIRETAGFFLFFKEDIIETLRVLNFVRTGVNVSCIKKYSVYFVAFRNLNNMRIVRYVILCKLYKRFLESFQL